MIEYFDRIKNGEDAKCVMLDMQKEIDKLKSSDGSYFAYFLSYQGYNNGEVSISGSTMIPLSEWETFKLDMEGNLSKEIQKKKGVNNFDSIHFVSVSKI